MYADSEIESLLQVGGVVVLHVGPESTHGLRYRACIRGWHKSSHIILDRPRLKNRYCALEEGMPCSVRFVTGGTACAFDSRVVNWEERPKDAYCTVAWPAQIHLVPFRRYYRIRVALPCRFSAGDEVWDGEIRDLSMGGCGIVTQTPVEEGTTLLLAFSLPDGLPLENVHTIVRDVRPMGPHVFLGCEFSDRQEDVQSDIAYSVSVAFEHERGAAHNPLSHILIIDENEGNTAPLRRGFEQRGWDVFTVSGTIDGLQRLRTQPPAALVVSQTQRDLTGLDIVRLVKLTRGFELLPVFLYGGDNHELEDKALQMGVSEYFPTPLEPTLLCDAVIASLAVQRR